MCSKIRTALSILLSCFLPCVSCTVKEDRSACSAFLALDLNAVRAFEEVSLALDNDADSYLWTLHPQDGDDVLEIRRGRYRKYAWHSSGDGPEGEGWIIEEGEDCPEIYIETGTLDVREECVSDSIILHKQFARLSISLKGAVSREAKVSVEGKVCGCRFDGTPVPGRFVCSKLEMKLPRQRDDSLEMELSTPQGSCRLPIGLYIAGSGYDWMAEDLGDIVLEIDVSVFSLELSVNGWRRSLSFDIVI